jgi:hypothetical protein
LFLFVIACGVISAGAEFRHAIQKIIFPNYAPKPDGGELPLT